MLDPAQYRREESRAKAQLPNWRLAQRHGATLFQRVGFPVRVDCLDELGMLLDTMQEGRFEAIQQELGGLAEAEQELLVQALAEVVRFQLAHFGSRAPVLPLDTVTAMLAAYRKMQALSSGFGRVLEVGPGCGYLGLFLARHAELERYAAVEATESFYLLQHHLLAHLFGAGFREELAAQGQSAHFGAEFEAAAAALPIMSALPAACATHHPWWRLGDLARTESPAAGGKGFDLIVCNAAMLEFEAPALRDYLDLFNRVLAPGGLVFAQCFGFETPERDRNYLLAALREARLAPVFMAWGGHPKGRGFWEQRSPAGCPAFVPGADDRRFTTAQGVFVAEGHPLWEAASRPENYCIHTMSDFAPLAHFFARPQGARVLSAEELARKVADAL
ncbi:MAG TPA: class I SAM-dependent methyltransferase [Humidesulfovibrio sp.]|uniref:class I SAM-dependent methyltransferase n=1 Tax=Humidesulfovibrio sp. TaxID=2910988 RepID=UPI002C768C1C|nr:class I SAM-dependent methyltransferase [Humidesulfovibrio sp.]HWR02807.1 class I SAM-dependent methyltransferase [Humidesulfovibrio sp.]